MTNPTPSPAPQQWADKAADEIFAIHVETGLTGRCEDVAAIITKHAAALSEENERLRWEVRAAWEDASAKAMQLNEQRQWSEQAREAMARAASEIEQHRKDVNDERSRHGSEEAYAYARPDYLDALLAAHPAAPAEGQEGRIELTAPELTEEQKSQPSPIPVIPWRDYGNPRQG